MTQGSSDGSTLTHMTQGSFQINCLSYINDYFLYLNFIREKSMKEQIVPKEEILTILEQKEYSAEWFFEQWSNNKRNALGALKNFSDEDIGLLISNLRDYLISQSFFNFNKKLKIQRCIEDVIWEWERRQILKQIKKNDEITGSQQARTLKENADLYLGLIGHLAVIIGAIVSIVKAKEEADVIGSWVVIVIAAIGLLILIICHRNVIIGKIKKQCSKNRIIDENKSEENSGHHMRVEKLEVNHKSGRGGRKR